MADQIKSVALDQRTRKKEEARTRRKEREANQELLATASGRQRTVMRAQKTVDTIAKNADTREEVAAVSISLGQEIGRRQLSLEPTLANSLKGIRGLARQLLDLNDQAVELIINNELDQALMSVSTESDKIHKEFQFIVNNAGVHPQRLHR